MGRLNTAQHAGPMRTLPGRIRRLQRLGVLCGITAGAWLGAAEVPTKLVSAGLSPFLISFLMVVGVFLGRWTLPAAARGTALIRHDIGKAPHLVVWAILAGCLWSVANTLTIFAIRDLGLSIAFPLWNTNALIGLLWGVVFFQELRTASWVRWMAVWSGAALMFLGGLILARVSVSQIASGVATKGIIAALGAGLVWGTMYIPYRKAYLSGMNPFSFVSFFTFGELGMMVCLAVRYLGGTSRLWHQVIAARHLAFWLLGAGFLWVLGDIFQQYAVKYSGVSRGIPLSNSNQLWGLTWGAVAFGELRNWGHSAMVTAVYGSLITSAGLVAISLSTAQESEYERWRSAAEREQARYGIEAQFISSALEGRSVAPREGRRWLDWFLIAAASAAFLSTAAVAEWPPIELNWTPICVLIVISLLLFVTTVLSLWRTTSFN